MARIEIDGRRGDGVLNLAPVEGGENPRDDVAVWIEQDGKMTTVHTTLDEIEQAIAEYRVLHVRAAAPSTPGGTN